MLPNTSSSRMLHLIIHRFLFFMMSFQNAFLTLIGKVQNSIPFTVVADPSSIYFNYRIKSDQLEAFRAYINLPAGFELCPMQCIDNEDAEYLLTQNIYEVTGLASGQRCEWSTYVLDQQGIPRYMVLEARSSKYSMDPVHVITPKGRVEHSMNKDEIVTTIASNEGKLFKSTIKLNPNAPMVRIYGDWIEANDFIYWRNGMCDRAYYGAGLANARVRLFDANDVQIHDDTHWVPFIDPTPKHVMQFEGAIDFNIVMWANL